MTSWHLNIWKVKIWSSKRTKRAFKVKQKKHFFLFHKCSLLDTKQASKNAADTIFSTHLKRSESPFPFHLFATLSTYLCMNFVSLSISYKLFNHQQSSHPKTRFDYEKTKINEKNKEPITNVLLKLTCFINTKNLFYHAIKTPRKPLS